MAALTTARSVTKRDGSKQDFDKSKVLNRLQNLSKELNEEYVKFDEVVEKVANGVYEGNFFVCLYHFLGVSTEEIDELLAET